MEVEDEEVVVVVVEEEEVVAVVDEEEQEEDSRGWPHIDVEGDVAGVGGWEVGGGAHERGTRWRRGVTGV